MNPGFTLDFASDYINVRYPTNYEITPENQQKLWAVVREACRQHNCHRVLAESPTPPKRNMTQIDAFKSAGQAAKVSSELRVACLYSDYQPDEITEFFVTVAYNKGIRIEFFSEREEALKWLKADSENSLN